MEAEPVNELPAAGWYEPEYDGFRCLAFRDDADVHLQSRKQKPLGRYFAEIAAACLVLPTVRFVLDGELIIPGKSFEVLQLRLQPFHGLRSCRERRQRNFIAFHAKRACRSSGGFNRIRLQVYAHERKIQAPGSSWRGRAEGKPLDLPGHLDSGARLQAKFPSDVGELFWVG